MTNNIRLYDYWRSTASYRVRIALNLARLPYETRPVDLVAGDQRAPEHLRLNPQGLVPVLDIDGLQLTQSLAILDYLEDTGRLDLTPVDPALAVKMRSITQAIACDIHPVCNLRVVSHAAALTGDPATKADWMRHFIRPGLEAVESLLGQFDGPYCLGSQLTQADVVLIPQTYNANRWQVEITDLKRIMQVVDSCKLHPAFEAAKPENTAPALTM